MGTSELMQIKAHSHINCAQPATRTWQRKFDDDGKKIELFSATMHDLLSTVPMIFRGLMINAEEMGKGRDIIFDPFKKWMVNCYRGLPLGGLGKHREKLQRILSAFSDIPAIYEERPILANQFSAFISRPNGKSYSTVLSAPSADVLKGTDKAAIGYWDWKLKEKNCTYHALFPRS